MEIGNQAIAIAASGKRRRSLSHIKQSRLQRCWKGAPRAPFAPNSGRELRTSRRSPRLLSYSSRSQPGLGLLNSRLTHVSVRDRSVPVPDTRSRPAPVGQKPASYSPDTWPARRR
jgi:hypothetical protein